jgi:hypothetical protein
MRHPRRICVQFRAEACLLVANERRGHIDPAGTAIFLAHLATRPIAIDRAPGSEMIMALARDHGRTIYDAGYLELALRLVIPSRPWTLPWPRPPRPPASSC